MSVQKSGLFCAVTGEEMVFGESYIVLGKGAIGSSQGYLEPYESEPLRIKAEEFRRLTPDQIQALLARK